MGEKIPTGTCPYCGGALEPGYIYPTGGPGVFFLRHPARKLQTFRSLMKEEGTIVLNPWKMVAWKVEYIPASVCRSCEVVIQSYHKE